MSLSQYPPPITSVSSGGVVLDSTLAGETSNSYCSLSYASTYWTAHYNLAQSDQWLGLGESQQIILLVQACRIIEKIKFVGPPVPYEYNMRYDRRLGEIVSSSLGREPSRYYLYQKLQFPRNIDTYSMQPPPGVDIGSLYMRQEPQDAQCEQAMYLLNLDQTAAANRMQGVSSDSFGLGQNALTQTQQYAEKGTLLAPMALEILSGLMVKGGRLQRG